MCGGFHRFFKHTNIHFSNTQADFTDVSVLPVIVSRLKEEHVEVIHFDCPHDPYYHHDPPHPNHHHYDPHHRHDHQNQVGILVNNVGILGPGNLPFLELDLAIVKVRCSISRGLKKFQ